MKVGDLRKLRTWCRRQRGRHHRSWLAEPYGPMNLGRARLDGRVEAYDAVLAHLDRMLARHRAAWVGKAKA